MLRFQPVGQRDHLCHRNAVRFRTHHIGADMGMQSDKLQFFVHNYTLQRFTGFAVLIIESKPVPFRIDPDVIIHADGYLSRETKPFRDLDKFIQFIVMIDMDLCFFADRPFQSFRGFIGTVEDNMFPLHTKAARAVILKFRHDLCP